MAETATSRSNQQPDYLEKQAARSAAQAAEQTQRKDSWTVHDFSGIQAIGSGKFGKVFKAVERSTGVPCALKVVFKNMLEKFDFFSQMKRELEI